MAASVKSPSLRNGLAFIGVVALGVIGLTAVAVAQRAAGDNPVVVTDAPRPIAARIQRVAYSDAFDLTETFSGMATARRASALGFETGGRIAAIYVDTGDKIEKGQELARLDTRALRAQLAAADAQTAEAQASYDLAELTVARQQTLVSQGHVAQQRYDEAFANAAAAAARIEAAKARAETLRVQIDLARLNAPFSGVVAARQSDEGAIAAPGAPILELVETAAVEARVGLPADLAADLNIGDTYVLETAAGTFSAEFRASTGVISATDRTVVSVFDFAEAPPPGSVVRLAMKRSVAERGFWAPVTALTEADRGLWAIYAVVEDDAGARVERRLVELVHAEAEQVYVRGAIQDDEAFVRDGLQRITPGALVTPVGAEG